MVEKLTCFLINFGTSNKEQLSYKRHSSRQIVKNSDDPYEAIRNKRISLDPRRHSF